MEIIVELSKLGEECYITGSQAKRILQGLEKFTHVTLAFSRINMVGQGFVDEVFRVYQHRHPNIRIVYIHANNDVEFMLKRGIATGQMPT